MRSYGKEWDRWTSIKKLAFRNRDGLGTSSDTLVRISLHGRCSVEQETDEGHVKHWEGMWKKI